MKNLKITTSNKISQSSFLSEFPKRLIKLPISITANLLSYRILIKRPGNLSQPFDPSSNTVRGKRNPKTEKTLDIIPPVQ